jgi:hypothetical protein
VRKPNPQDIYIARRTAHFRRLADEYHLDELDSEHWLSAWEREAEMRGLDRHARTFWQDGEEWILERRRGGSPRACGRG